MIQGSHVEEIKSRLPIDEVIGSYLTLEHKGKYLCARCPFHNEKSASFYVSTDRDTYYCFGCGEKGDIFSFVEKYEGVDFRGALTMLANRAGVKLSQVSKESIDKKEMEYNAMEEATKFFEGKLLSNVDALHYIKSRNVNDDTIKKFRIGFAPSGWTELYDHLQKLGYTSEIMQNIGLTVKTEKGTFDRFRNRIMFPVEDSSGRVIAFSGRILPQYDDGKSGKYINSPETDLYHKSNVLYGFSKAKQYIRKHDFSVLVEGQFDVILSHQNGFPNTVAVSGTAFSGDTKSGDGIPTHIGIISRLSKNIILALDADDAGQKATLRVISEAMPLEMNIKLLPVLENAKDPADILQDNSGIEIWKNLLKDAEKPIEALCKRIINKETERTKQINDVKRILYPIVSSMPSALDRHEAGRVIEKYFSVPLEYIQKDIEEMHVKNIKPNKNENIQLTDYPQNTVNKSIKDLFFGTIFLSEIPDSIAYRYRNNILEFIEENIPEDIYKQEKIKYLEKKDILILESEVELSKTNKLDDFVEDIKLQYEELIFRDIVDDIKQRLLIDENNQELTAKYAEYQKRIEIIKQKRRNI